MAVDADISLFPPLDKSGSSGSVFVIEARLTSWTTVYWGPVVEADVVLAALRAAGVPAELVYQSTGPGVVPGPGPTDSRVVVPDAYAKPAERLIARAGRKQRQLGTRTATRSARPDAKQLVGRVIAILFLAGILWTLANVMFPPTPPPNLHRLLPDGWFVIPY
jgi:hypothetical protein